ncbi:MAG TPA: hypothetical protein VE967_01785, partial [Gemmatimonadaceae bacterium]|nr:hypothetical protein [Gemmatimonadaceae bacterium]
REREDRRYRGLRTVLRHPLSKWAYRLLHPDIGMWLAFRSSHTSRATRPRDGGAGLRSVAQNVLAERRDLDLVVLGHSHVRTLERVPTGGVFANPGCWLDLPAFLAIDDATIELREWNGSAEGHRLDALDRGAKKALTNA